MKQKKEQKSSESTTARTSIRYCFGCIENHLMLAHGFLEKAEKSYDDNGLDMNVREHIWEAQKNISLAEEYCRKAPKEIKLKLKDTAKVLRLIRKMINKSRIAFLNEKTKPIPINLKDRSLSVGEVIEESIIGVYNVLLNLYELVSEEK